MELQLSREELEARRLARTWRSVIEPEDECVSIDRWKPGKVPLIPPRTATADLVLGIEEVLQRYVATGGEERLVIAAWILHAASALAFSATPRILITSPIHGCGKSTLANVIGQLLGWIAEKSECMTAAAIYRTIDSAKVPPVLILDEFDNTLAADKELAARLRQLINSGFARDGKVRLCDGKEFVPRSFKTYAPAVFAFNRSLPPSWAPTSSRAIDIRLERKSRNSQVSGRLRAGRVSKDLALLSKDIRSWSTRPEVMAFLRDADPQPLRIDSDRREDVWGPLLAIAEHGGEPIRSRIREAAKQIETRQGTREEKCDELLLLEDIRTYMTGHDGLRDFSHTRDMLNWLNSLDERPWRTIRIGRPLSAEGLARILKQFGLAPSHTRQGNGYSLDNFVPIWEQYLNKPSH